MVKTKFYFYRGFFYQMYNRKYYIKAYSKSYQVYSSNIIKLEKLKNDNDFKYNIYIPYCKYKLPSKILNISRDYRFGIVFLLVK